MHEKTRDIYVETIDDIITWVAGDLSGEATFADVTGDAKLAISPDGYLIRIIGDPVSEPTWEELALE